MKNFIIIYCLLVYAFGYTFNNINISESNDPSIKVTENVPFLASIMSDGHLYLQIPESTMGKPLLWTRIGPSTRYESKHIVLSRSGNNILLEEHRVWSEAGVWIPLKGSLSLEKNILGVFPILQNMTDSKIYRIDVTEFLLDNKVSWKWDSANTVPSLSTIVGKKDLDQELIIKTNQILNKNGTKLSQFVYFSFYALQKPMEARKFDYRMGFFHEDFFSDSKVSAVTKNYIASIARVKLEKKYPDQQISVPVKPITFTLSPDIPKMLRPYIKAGLEEWLPAFEAAGFKDAILVKEVDTLSDWDNYGLSNSIVRWIGSENIRRYDSPSNSGTTISVIDLRSGEIIKSDIRLNNFIELQQERYFVQCAPLDKRANSFPFPDELAGELMQSLTAHEAGHTFGLKDANYGEYTYPVEKMGDIFWLKKMGHTPSIMTYGRHNNIAQPEDSVPPSLLIQKLGPTDIYNIRWAYTEFPSSITAKDKEARLEKIIRLQDSIPWYRYNNNTYEVIGPAATNNVVETDDPVKSTRLALKNLKRVMEMLPDACKGQKDNARLESLYSKTLDKWNNHMRHVISVIGGYKIFYKAMDQPENIYTPIPLESQIEAIDFIIDNAFNPPDWLVNPNFNSLIKYSTYPDNILPIQQLLLLELLRPTRMKRFEYMQTIDGYEGMLQRYLIKLQSGLFRELTDGTKVKPRNQEIQMTYIDRLIPIIKEERVNYEADKKKFDYTDYTKGLMIEQLMSLKKDIEKEIKKNRESSSLGHWKLCLNKLNEVL